MNDAVRAQIIEVSGHRMAVLPEADYRQLLDMLEDREDVLAAERAEQRRLAGEEYIPLEIVDRLIDGENPVRVWRQYRGLTQAELASRIGVSNMAISGLERGRSGSLKLFRSIANELRVSLEDLLPDE
ncbi:helix-turn-helix domain-containing protein [Sphingomonas sp.]|uniref:helix-turn-helix transcriptional regulator n=1 Tax=Sphingomonas sp. TaxID=28214 RepID=UPI001EC10A73|nr:helix-turn-helix domain-containing protein [Sphingomonas sp.]MBX3595351.1 helix-turn-helix domain-containing protein [Sphingomonas sp.]